MDITARNLKVFFTQEETSDSTMWFIKNVHVQASLRSFLISLELGISLGNRPLKVGKHRSYIDLYKAYSRNLYVRVSPNTQW